MNADTPLTDRGAVQAQLEELLALWHEPSRAVSETELPRDGLAWEIAITAGQLASLGTKPAEEGQGLDDAELWAAAARRFSTAALGTAWRKLTRCTERLHELHDRPQPPDEVEADLTFEVRELAEHWVTEREELACGAEALRRAARSRPSLRPAVLDALAKLEEADERARERLDLLFPAVALCRGTLETWSHASAPLDRRERWWWHEPVRRFDALRAAEPTVIAKSPGAGKIISLEAVRSGLLRLNRERQERPPLRLAADSADDEPAPRIVRDFAMEGTGLSLRAELSDDGHTLVLVALDENGRASAALDGHRLVLEPTEGVGAPGRRVTFEGPEAVVDLGTEGLGVFESFGLRLEL